jgi:hypothetical protein
MSQSSAIASVTAALFHLLDNAGINVTTLSPNNVSAGGNEQINLFLYGTEINPAFRNDPMPGAVPPGRPGPPPLALVLRYLITAYGDNSINFSVHEILGKAMLVLHDNAILTNAQISGLDPEAGLTDQYEKIKITPLPLSLDDMSKLWTSFQSDYRLSVAYEVSVVLIESGKDIKSPLPVLKRGEHDQGASVLPSPSPEISGFRFPNQKPAANLGDTITLLGENLSGAGITVRFKHPRRTDPIEKEPEANSSEFELLVKIPDATDPGVVSDWSAGFYKVSLVVRLPDTPVWTSNILSMPLSPEIKTLNPTTIIAADGSAFVDIDCIPQVKLDQHIDLLFDGQAIAAEPYVIPMDSDVPTSLQFLIGNPVARTTPYVLRLRIDGVDSIPVDFSGVTPEFADNQKLEVT